MIAMKSFKHYKYYIMGELGHIANVGEEFVKKVDSYYPFFNAKTNEISKHIDKIKLSSQIWTKKFVSWEFF